MHTISTQDRQHHCAADGTTLPRHLCTELDHFIEQLSQKEGNLVAVLHKAQNLFGYLPREVQEYVAERLDGSRSSGNMALTGISTPRSPAVSGSAKRVPSSRYTRTTSSTSRSGPMTPGRSWRAT